MEVHRRVVGSTVSVTQLVTQIPAPSRGPPACKHPSWQTDVCASASVNRYYRWEACADQHALGSGWVGLAAFSPSSSTGQHCPTSISSSATVRTTVSKRPNPGMPGGPGRATTCAMTTSRGCPHAQRPGPGHDAVQSWRRVPGAKRRSRARRPTRNSAGCYTEPPNGCAVPLVNLWNSTD